MRGIYALFGAKERVHAVQFDAPHNYNRDSREAVYAWMARWLKGAPADDAVPEKEFQVDPLAELLVFRPAAARRRGEPRRSSTENWISAAKRQLAAANPQSRAARCSTLLGFERQRRPGAELGEARSWSWPPRTATSGGRVARAGFAVRRVASRRSTRTRPRRRSRTSTPTTAPGQPARRRPGGGPVQRSRGRCWWRTARGPCPACWRPPSLPVTRAMLDVGGFDLASDERVPRAALHAGPPPGGRSADGGGDGEGRCSSTTRATGSPSRVTSRRPGS